MWALTPRVSSGHFCKPEKMEFEPATFGMPERYFRLPFAIIQIVYKTMTETVTNEHY